MIDWVKWLTFTLSFLPFISLGSRLAQSIRQCFRYCPMAQRLNDQLVILLRFSYKFQACCSSPQNHCQGFGFVMEGRVQVLWEAEFLLRTKFTF